MMLMMLHLREKLKLNYHQTRNVSKGGRDKLKGDIQPLRHSSAHQGEGTREMLLSD